MKSPGLLILAACAYASGQTVLVQPYVQPGDGATLTGSDVKVLTWLTDQKPGAFTVEFGWEGAPGVRTAVPTRVALDFEKAKPKSRSAPKDQKPKPPEDEPATTLDDLKLKVIETFSPIEEREQHYYRYRAELTGLPFDSLVGWRVKNNGATLREGAVKTRATAAKPIRFIAVGDMASNKPEQRGIAWQMSLVKPDFIIALGDIVYPGGRVLQYLNHFFPCYNDVPVAGPKAGAPLARNIPIYPVIGNHDADTQKFPDYPDAYSCYYWFSVPKNGPGAGPWNTPLGKNDTLATAFRAGAGAEYPAMGHYSFDYGPAHILVLDANSYSIREVEKLLPWVERDLAASKAPWKIACFHHPAFHTSREHYTEQRMRLLQPAFERGGVTLILAGHVHNYQRSKPLTFQPGPKGRDARGRINGTLVLDETFDGNTHTTPRGTIHIVTGGGGAKLYSVDLGKTIASLKRDHGENYIPLTAKYVADKHSFTVLDLTPTQLDLRQINIDGQEVDRIRITK
jgi:acid phosphatase type 7